MDDRLIVAGLYKISVCGSVLTILLYAQILLGRNHVRNLRVVRGNWYFLMYLQCFYYKGLMVCS